MSGGEPCICNAQGRDECKLLTRLMVLLPETGTSLGWQLSSTGETAADELDLAMKIAEGLAQGRPFVPGTLSLTQRKGQLDGKATRFVVPVLGFDPVQQALVAGELPPARVALPTGYTPLEPPSGNGVTLADGLEAAETQTVTRTARSAAPIPRLDEDIPFGEAPVPVPGEVVTPEPKIITRSQRARLFAIAREYGVTKEHVRELLMELTGSESTAELTVADYDSLVAIIQSRDPVNA
jgi:hypothetical protein